MRETETKKSNLHDVTKPRARLSIKHAIVMGPAEVRVMNGK